MTMFSRDESVLNVFEIYAINDISLRVIFHILAKHEILVATLSK